ncbi:MAG: sigma-70 family RNA polymerase sigma factor [Phototrophicaceae bacterium]
MDDFVQLIQQAQSKDAHARRDAFDALMPQFQKMAFYVAYNRLQDVHVAEDVVQEAFLTAYLKLDQLRDPQAFAGWLKQIVLSHCDRYIRGKKPQLEPIDARYDLATDNPSPEAMVEEVEMHNQVLYAIESLPEHERAVTEGFYMQGESQKELAARLKVPVTTVKKRLQYAREHLRLMIGDLNAVVDEAIARVIQANQPTPEPQPQPVYIYSRSSDTPIDDGY